MGLHGCKDRYFPDFSLITFFVAVIGVVIASCFLLADYFYTRTERLLDDSATEYLDVLPLTSSSMSTYLSAVQSIEKAHRLIPFYSKYTTALSELYETIGSWSATVKILKATIPAEAPEKRTGI